MIIEKCDKCGKEEKKDVNKNNCTELTINGYIPTGKNNCTKYVSTTILLCSECSPKLNSEQPDFATQINDWINGLVYECMENYEG